MKTPSKETFKMAEQRKGPFVVALGSGLEQGSTVPQQGRWEREFTKIHTGQSECLRDSEIKVH